MPDSNYYRVENAGAAIPAAIVMGVAAFRVHGDNPFQMKELALLYLVIFVAIALVGPGKFSIDRK